MINCIFKNNIEVAGYIIKARTKGYIMTENKRIEPNCAVMISVYVSTYDIEKFPNMSKLEAFHNVTNKQPSLDGIVIGTTTDNICIDVDEIGYINYGLYKHQIQKVLECDKLPSNIRSVEHSYNKYRLGDLLSHLNNKFSDWVKENAIFMEVTQEMIDDDQVSNDYEDGDSILVNIKDFYEEQLKYKQMLERIGFTYEFNGGLRLTE
jgi:hypothetical protein